MVMEHYYGSPTPKGPNTVIGLVAAHFEAKWDNPKLFVYFFKANLSFLFKSLQLERLLQLYQ